MKGFVGNLLPRTVLRSTKQFGNVALPWASVRLGMAEVLPTFSASSLRRRVDSLGAGGVVKAWAVKLQVLGLLQALHARKIAAHMFAALLSVSPLAHTAPAALALQFLAGGL